MRFEQLALAEMPQLSTIGTITRKEIEQIATKYCVPFPQRLTHSANIVSRGVYKFNANIDNCVTIEPIIAQAIPATEESDEELNTRIFDSYRSLDILVNSVAKGSTPSLIISGNAGIGKSFTVKSQLEKSGNEFVFVRGYVKSTGIFRLLYDNRFSGQTIVFDDSDSVFDDSVSLNLLKGALELTKTKSIGWLSEKEFISEDGTVIPRNFQYEGSVIFLTNLDFDNIIKKDNKVSPHLAALKSRSLYFNLEINTPKEILTRIKQVVATSDINKKHNINDYMMGEIISYLEINIDNLSELSIRTYEKLAGLIAIEPLFWETLADRLILKR